MVYFFGYEPPSSVDGSMGSGTSAKVTPGDARDGVQFPGLLESDLTLRLAPEIVRAHRACDQPIAHCMLEVRALHQPIRFNDYRTQKTDRSKADRIAMRAKP
jgi:hypothetical protein